MGERFSEERLSQVLADCLDALNGSDADIEALVQRYPDLEPELRPLLEMAALLRRKGSRAEPAADFLDHLKERLLVASRARGP